ncbi:TetR/AcrR family transcriptional regulator [Halopseudomonas salegens]|uniref:Transcriptional regulator, TetR family n=1 Tax=Halopseudomonas salegens TaxID=1434072 RepID=A0A1H2EQF8_9GAMM|nr:TetR/AcrR family transcriptional regulator [Halopseudomonas salegens]SDT97183.1 transcriptional regulator, TetR family [Halopseudomonas salegens]
MQKHETKPARSIPVSEKGRKTRASILDVAENILIEEGYGELSSRGIADRLGIRLSNVQYYFPVRGSLLSGVFERALHAAQADLMASSDHRGLEPLVRYILTDQQSSRSCRLFWELWALAAKDEIAAGVKAAFYSAYQDALQAAIAVEVPDSSDQQRRHRALLIMSLLEGVSLFRDADGTGALDDSLVAAALALARGGKGG